MAAPIGRRFRRLRWAGAIGLFLYGATWLLLTVDESAETGGLFTIAGMLALVAAALLVLGNQGRGWVVTALVVFSSAAGGWGASLSPDVSDGGRLSGGVFRTPTPTAAAGPTPTPTRTPSTEDLFAAEWDALITAAQHEGELDLRMASTARFNYRPLVEFFGQKFGIQPVVQSRDESLIPNVLAERATGRYLVDVMFVGPGIANEALIPERALDPIAEQFIHPEVLDTSLWFERGHWWGDVDQQYVFTMSASVVPIVPMWYNPELVSQEDIDGINSVWDYLDPKWKGKIVARSPLVGRVDRTYYEAYIHPEIGPEWIDVFFSRELGVTFVDDFRLVVDGIVKGDFVMGIALDGAAEQTLEAFRELGLPAKAIRRELKEGRVMRGSLSQNNIAIPTNRPHESAAKLFVNWLLSQEGQTLMHTLSEQIPHQTLRTDVTDLGKTLPFERRDPDREYYFLHFNPVFTSQRENAIEYTKDAFNATR